MTLRTVVSARAVVALVATLLVAGCTSGPGGAAPNTSASAPADAAAAMRAVAACLRSHGYPNAPDPVQDQDGNWGFGNAPEGSMPDRNTATPCDDLARRAKTLSRGNDRDRVSAADLTKLRAYATCVRRHGVADWPDPSARGDFEVPPRLEPPQGEAIVRDAHKACESALGGVDLRIAQPGGGDK